MFSPRQIEDRIWVLNTVAEKFETRAKDEAPWLAAMSNCTAMGLRQGAEILERMVQDEIELEALDAIERGIA